MSSLSDIRNVFARNLSAKAAAAVILAVGLTMAASTLYHFYAATADAESDLRERGKLLATLLADALARPMFDFNNATVGSVVGAVGAGREIGAIRVLDSSSNVVASTGKWERGSDEAILIERPIRFVDSGKEIPVGVLELLLLRHDLREHLRDTLLRGIVTNAFLGSTIILLLLFLARGPRRDFGDVLQALESLRAGETPQRVAGLNRRDEVGRLAAAVDSFREAIAQRRAAETAQQQLQLELQQARERAAQEALDRSREQYRLVVENVAEGILVVQDGRIVLANPPVCALVGESVETLGSRPFIDFVHPDDRDLVMDRHMRRMRGETIEPRYSFRIVDRQGKAIWVELSAVIFEWQGQPATLSFITDITQRHQAEEDTRQALAKQRELNELKSRFVSMTSHEFRTPLATILSSVELIKYYSDRLPAGEKEELIASIENAIRRMTKMLDDVLVIGRADAGRLEFKPAVVDAGAAGRRIAEEAARAVAPDGTALSRLDFDCDNGEPRLLDELLLRHILGNLVSNAFKYSPPTGRVSVRVELRNEQVRICVSDRGIGIPKADLPRLFETFHRATNVGNVPGTGLGMTIVKRALDLHGGDIAVESEEGEGSTFCVTLPTPRC